MPGEETVVIPEGTLVHVGGMPFRLTGAARAEGREGNLRRGLEALSAGLTPPASVDPAISAAQQIRAVALVLVGGNTTAITERMLEITHEVYRTA